MKKEYLICGAAFVLSAIFWKQILVLAIAGAGAYGALKLMKHVGK